MRFPLRQLVVMLVLVVVGGFTSACALDASGGRPTTGIRLQVVDQAGRAVPYATVWQTTSPCLRYDPTLKGYCFEPEELQRVAEQFRESFEYFTASAGLHPYEQIHYVGASDASGTWLNRGTLADWGAPQPRDRVTVMFAVSKQGYLPAVADVTLTGPSLMAHERKVVLRPDPQFPRQEGALRGRFEVLLQEIYATQRKKPGLPPGPPRELIDIQRELEDLAKQAEAAGDKPLAARAYYRLAYMPGVINSSEYSGKVTGYFSEPSKEVTQSLMTKAGLLEPRNPRFIRQTLAEGVFTPEQRSRRWVDVPPDRLRGFATSAEKTLRPLLPHLWPTEAMGFSGVYKALKEFDEACQWIIDLGKAHPKYSGTNHLKKSLRNDVKKSGHAVPAACATD